MTSLKETHILIATGGYLNDQVVVERIIIDESDMDDDFESFEEYAEYLIEDSVGEYAQGFSQTFVINEEQLPTLIDELNKAKDLINP
jgi:hypothetical protein